MAMTCISSTLSPIQHGWVNHSLNRSRSIQHGWVTVTTAADRSAADHSSLKIRAHYPSITADHSSLKIRTLPF
jgi:hypothetical protein